MKTIKSLLAVSILTAAAGQAFATCYNVTGSMTGINTVDATADPDLWVHAGSTGYNTSTPLVFPTFTSATFCIDTTTTPATVTGTFGDFAQYTTTIRAAVVLRAHVNQTDAVYDFNGGTVTWTPVSPGSPDGTLTLGQLLVMPNDATETAADNLQTSDASLTFTGTPGTCTAMTSASQVICDGQQEWFIDPPNEHMEKFYMTLTISGGGTAISGTAVGSDVGGVLSSAPPNRTGDTWYSFSFSGTP